MDSVVGEFGNCHPASSNFGDLQAVMLHFMVPNVRFYSLCVTKSSQRHNWLWAWIVETATQLHFINNHNQKHEEKEVSFTVTEIVTARSLTFISFLTRNCQHKWSRKLTFAFFFIKRYEMFFLHQKDWKGLDLCSLYVYTKRNVSLY